MKYKMICTDMDGTLLNTNKEISDKTKEAIKRADEMGVHVVLSTGRMFNSANYYASMIDIKTPIISANGAFIRDRSKEDVIYKNVLGKENCKILLEILKRHKIHGHFHTPSALFSDKLVFSAKIYDDMNKDLPEDNKIEINIIKDNWDEVFEKNEESIVKCIGIDEDVEKVKRAKIDMLKVKGIEVVSSYENNFEIMTKGVSKGRGVEILAAYYNIKPEEIICIGDNENDLSMIKFAGLGVAMGNAPSNIKEEADYVTDTNDNDGVAKVIEKFILNSL
ncbi:Cof-type HAD-IIB family hydrolase [Clostridium algidicarnis]|uniref:Cof subfamily protein (Haloacid dehalogenase superfamily)/HAD superfamily hydrolase (TIGR01484 family) n=2 Tax=Clostridium algidicarnis TaxID=37659 RepID=A0A2S6G0J0_9CLOT|nr:Cof-type HAD-IIB family hydrolase [Clostridium algidicarnis]MBB6696727.1 HAD family phosphatase [Clostridium algidicarnis]MBU3192671.1 Cof-type HAD-IIB family hydrolase [Clostridium algidicarnis]MBU3203995.1 Cof-type HAD-IIB family hydrolase [Clostridium algidicarnis]MBU3207392.1 Cof-type HAD-IIB family hydrolase [Clostridium algidicarnis]MBU3212149.1 Cof-type HAD-IIB family hydrolase [Clostridium algidicarnis]